MLLSNLFVMRLHTWKVGSDSVDIWRVYCDQLVPTQCYWLATAAVTLRILLCCNLFAAAEYRCKMVQQLPRAQSVKRLTTVGIDVLTAVVMKSTVFWDITPCRRWMSIDVSEGHLHLQSRKNTFSKKPAWKLDLFFRFTHKSKSKSVTTDGQSVSSSWYRAPDCYCLTVTGLSVGRPLWRGVGSVICHSLCQSIVNRP
jgi:hypothetical protein